MFIRMTTIGLTLAATFVFAAPALERQEAPVRLAGAQDEAATYRVDPVHSTVVFRIKHLNVAYFYGRFNEISGTIEWNAENPEASSLDIQIATASVDTANQSRDNHLRSADFFLAEEHPTIRFRTTGIERKGENEFEATGELTMRGVTRTITVDLEHTGKGTNPRGGQELIGLHSTFAVKRTDYDMPWGVENGALGDEVKLMIGIEGIRQ